MILDTIALTISSGVLHKVDEAVLIDLVSLLFPNTC